MKFFRIQIGSASFFLTGKYLFDWDIPLAVATAPLWVTAIGILGIAICKTIEGK